MNGSGESSTDSIRLESDQMQVCQGIFLSVTCRRMRRGYGCAHAVLEVLGSIGGIGSIGISQYWIGLAVQKEKGIL